MRILVLGITGTIGGAIGAELESRAHTVVGLSRTASGDTRIAGDATDSATVAAAASGCEVIASAVGPRVGVDDDWAVLVGTARAVIAAAAAAGHPRIVVLGGAGSLQLPDGSRLVDSAHFPAQWRANALAQAEVLALYRACDADWTYVSPASTIAPGDARGTWRTGGDELLVDPAGDSRISIADYAAAFADEVERKTARRARVSVAY